MTPPRSLGVLRVATLHACDGASVVAASARHLPPDAGAVAALPWRGGFAPSAALSEAFARTFAAPHTGSPRNVTSALPVDLDGDGQFAQAAATDLDDDGDLDLVVGQFGASAVAFENRVEPNGGHILLSLRSAVSASDGRGARVTVRTPAAKRVWPVGDRTTFQVTPSPLLDVVLGAAPRASELRILWPSGYEQSLTDVMPGRLAVTEPRWLIVEPRSVRAGSGARVTVSVRPTTSSGALDADAPVAIESPHRAVTWEGPAARGADGAWRRTLIADASPGSAVLRVTVNRREATVRPRVWFTAR